METEEESEISEAQLKKSEMRSFITFPKNDWSV